LKNDDKLLEVRKLCLQTCFQIVFSKIPKNSKFSICFTMCEV
jgi:hypothetical protein